MLSEQLERRARPTGRRRDLQGPVALVLAERPGEIERRQRSLRAGGHRDALATGEPQAVSDTARPPAARVGRRGDGDHLDPWPSEQHRQRARVIGVAAQIGVEMDPRDGIAPAHGLRL